MPLAIFLQIKAEAVEAEAVDKTTASTSLILSTSIDWRCLLGTSIDWRSLIAS